VANDHLFAICILYINEPIKVALVAGSLCLAGGFLLGWFINKYFCRWLDNELSEKEKISLWFETEYPKEHKENI
jgi:hypothetical protein